jgi:hypothetical protein
MTDALSPTVPAGWYPDPWGSASQRWWDGTAWSENLYPHPDAQPEEQSEPRAEHVVAEPVPVGAQERDASAASDEDYVPVAVRSTFEPATSYRDAAAPTLNSPYPSRRALRELATAASDEHAAAMTEDAPMQSEPHEAAIVGGLPAFTQAPEFSPEPVSALPPPVWQDPVAETEPEPEPVEKPVAEAVIESPQDAAAAPAATEPAASEPAAPELGFVAAEEPAAAPNSAPVENVDDDWAASLARWDDVDTTSAPPDALPIFGDAPPVSYSQRAMKYQPMHGRTSPVWLIVFMPVLHALCVVGSVYVFPGLLELDATIALMPAEAAALAMLPVLRDWLLFALLPLSIAFWVFTFIMGFQDRARLRLLGHDTTASPWWIVLSPLVYLIVRSVRVRQCTGRRGSGPLTTYICLYIAPPIAIIVASVVTSALYGAIPS